MKFKILNRNSSSPKGGRRASLEMLPGAAVCSG